MSDFLFAVKMHGGDEDLLRFGLKQRIFSQLIKK
jgi:hypothetical protein